MRTAPRRPSLAIAALAVLAIANRATAQDVGLGGRAYVDYFYTLSSPDEDEEGFHGFTYRRLYLTADFTLSDAFYGRARLEANDESIGTKGPEPYVKDLWLAWEYAGAHTALLGVMPPPAFEISEDVWGYRSLEKTILDFQGINNSRDFGIRFNGPLSENLQYAFMLANNSGVNPEVNDYKRIYGQLAFYPTENLVVTVGADHAGYDDPRDSGTRFSAFGGYISDELRVGLEGYGHRTAFDVGDDLQSIGASLFAAYRLDPAWELAGRFDVASEEFGEPDVTETFAILGVAYEPIEYVSIIPNLWLFNTDATDRAQALARMTVEVRF